MTDTEGNLLSEYKKTVHEKEYHHFQNVCKEIGSTQNMFLAQAYRYSHAYASDSMDIKQKNLESCTGVLLIRELPDTIKQKETEAEAYSAVWGSDGKAGEGTPDGICILRTGYSARTQ